MKLLSSLRPETRLGRPVALTTLFAFLIATIPGPALASAVRPVERFAASLDQRPEGYGRPLPKSRLLTAAMMAKAQGRSGENPYLAGQAKWDVVYKGINLMTGNYSTTGTDLTFEGGYGIPVNVTRSYSANSPDEGPLGKGWTLSVDVRSTAGGVLKSAGAPVRAVPLGFKNRPGAQTDPNAELATGAAAQPLEAVIATDAGGTEETIQVDADGVLTTPPWDKNTNETTYENVVQPDGSILRRTVSNKTFTPDGTVYVYQRLGTYPNGQRPWNAANAASEPSDVMKIVSATDRQGNVTTYGYGTTEVTFQKSNGTVTERRLESIGMPNGHHIDLTWSGNRIVKASDGIPAASGGREVVYAYNAAGDLTGVTTPGGKTTTYGYAVPQVPGQWAYEVAGPVLATITDPRGLTTTIFSWMHATRPSPMATSPSDWVPGVVVYRIAQPNGVDLWTNNGGGVPGSNPPSEMESGSTSAPLWKEIVGGPGGATIAHGYVRIIGSGASVRVMRGMGETDTAAPGYNQQLNFPGIISYDDFDPSSQNLLFSMRATRPIAAEGDESGRGLTATDTSRQTAATTTSYNFAGNPLKKTVVTTHYPVSSPYSATTTTNVVEYAYWGAERYWQQRMVRDEGAAFGGDDRISYTDYYTAADAAGSRGQTRKVYDAKNTAYTLDTTIPLPYGVDPNGANVWKYRLRPTTDTHAAEFTYDAKGRPTDVWKLQSTTTNPWTYVQTHTLYGADTDGSWGQASSVVEDYGGLNRTTATLHYDACGRADRVQDAGGKVFETHYDKDGVVQGVDRIVGGVASPVVTYTYGATPGTLTNGQVLSVKDELSGVLQEFGYVAAAGGGLGQVSGVIESGGPNPSYSTGYTYNAAGDRAISTLSGPDGTTKWGYAGYASLGEPTSPARVFRTLTRLNPTTGAPTAEEFHYAYDSSGRLREAAFAQTPSAASASVNGWYRDASGAAVPAASRARAHYEYDGAGRLASVAHWWDRLNASGTAYGTPVPILANACDYETAGLARGLKTASRFYRGNSGGTAWNLERTETYGYDDKNDQLTGANYGDAGANAVQSWTYDAAGNRASDSSQPGSWSYDNLNRILSSPQGTYTHDVLGNRLTGPASTSHTWDSLGRMTSLTKGSATTAYVYRADGMRVAKTGASTGETYRYDGQMPIETIETNGSTATVERHALGVRGTDLIERLSGGTTATRFPLYDAHGNSVATLGRPSGAGLPSLGDERSYDAWGRVRLGLQAGAPSARYCAILGHVQDDESGLVYMRARYYEASTGRFVSEDKAMDGGNWYAYCNLNPISASDPSGKFVLLDLLIGTFEEGAEKLRETIAANLTIRNAEAKVMAILWKFYEQYEHILGEDGFTIFGEEPLQFGVEGSFRINFHFSEEAMLPHDAPHIELAIKYITPKIQEFLH